MAKHGRGRTGKGHSTRSRKKSKNSAEPSSGSKRQWQTPRNVKDFAAQANQVATMLLNDQIPRDKARNYAAIARVVAQSVSIEVTKSRFLKSAPDLSLVEERLPRQEEQLVYDRRLQQTKTILNKYECPCGHKWADLWDCGCNDRCPKCNKEIEPTSSEEITV